MLGIRDRHETVARTWVEALLLLAAALLGLAAVRKAEAAAAGEEARGQEEQ